MLAPLTRQASCHTAGTSGKHGLNNLPAVDRRSLVTSIVEVRQLLIDESTAMQDCGVDVMDMDFVFDGPQPDLVGRTMRNAAADSAAG